MSTRCEPVASRIATSGSRSGCSAPCEDRGGARALASGIGRARGSLSDDRATKRPRNRRQGRRGAHDRDRSPKGPRPGLPGLGAKHESPARRNRSSPKRNRKGSSMSHSPSCAWEPMRTSSSASDPRPCAPRFMRLKARRNWAVRLTDRTRRPPCRPGLQLSRLSTALASAGGSNSTTSPRRAASTVATVTGFGTSAPESGPHPAAACSSTMQFSRKLGASGTPPTVCTAQADAGSVA